MVAPSLPELVPACELFPAFGFDWVDAACCGGFAPGLTPAVPFAAEPDGLGGIDGEPFVDGAVLDGSVLGLLVVNAGGTFEFGLGSCTAVASLARLMVLGSIIIKPANPTAAMMPRAAV